VTPFDVVKVRMQASSGAMATQIHECCHEVFFDGVIHSCPVHPKGVNASQFKGTWDGLRKIARYEGVSALWSGLAPTLVLQMPATVLYYLGYETIRDKLLASDASDGFKRYAPLMAGMSARTVAATLISPIELIRTRVQALSGKGHLVPVLREIGQLTRTQGYRVLWKGIGPTLWRDVPFSGIYWLGYESIRKRMLREDGDLHNALVSFYAGTISGVVAALVTTPFDVAKTVSQISSGGKAESMMVVMRRIVEQEGWVGLMRGWTARIAKVAPACGVMIGSYELGKLWFSQRSHL
jgi:solute carrier family 25 protein 39/40